MPTAISGPSARAPLPADLSEVTRSGQSERQRGFDSLSYSFLRGGVATKEPE